MSDILENEESEALFNAYQYLSMMLMRNLTDIHSALPNGDVESCRKNINNIKEILGSIEKAIEAMDEVLSQGNLEDEDIEDDDEIEDFLNEDFDDEEDVSEPVSLDEMNEDDSIS
jgi:hypothetical protein